MHALCRFLVGWLRWPSEILEDCHPSQALLAEAALNRIRGSGWYVPIAIVTCFRCFPTTHGLLVCTLRRWFQARWRQVHRDPTDL